MKVNGIDHIVDIGKGKLNVILSIVLNSEENEKYKTDSAFACVRVTKRRKIVFKSISGRADNKQFVIRKVPKDVIKSCIKMVDESYFLKCE